MGLFNLIFTLGVNRKPLQDGLNQAKGDVQSFGSVVKSRLAGAFATGAILAYAKSILDTAGKINDLSTRLGISTDMLQSLDFAAKQSGSTLDDFTTVLQKLAQARDDALDDPSGSKASAFSRFGISIAQLKTARLDDLLSGIADSMRETGDAQVYLADALELMGKSAGKVIPTMAEGLESVKEKAREAGQVISEEAIRELDQWGDKFSAFFNAIKVQAADTAGVLAGLHRNIAAIVDAVITSGKVPFKGFSSDAWMEAKAAWNTVRKNADHDMNDVFKIPLGDMGGMNGGRAVAREAEWVGPPLPPGWGEPEAQRKIRPWSAQRPSDSLVSVGNFLGTDPSRGMRQQFSKIMADLQAIKDNTKRTAEGAIMIRK